MKSLKPLFWICCLLLLLSVGLAYIKPILKAVQTYTSDDYKGGLDMVEKHFGSDIDSAAQVYDMNADYLKALCMLECSGKKAIEPRFEPHVYKQLKKVQLGELSNYEHVRPEMLADANDEALRNLASSWGPFQLMGYKCLLLGIKIRDIRGPESVLYGVKWIQMTYGECIKNKQFRDAFHIHNTGQRFPQNGKSKTHDPQYCQKGLRYMKHFESKHQ